VTRRLGLVWLVLAAVATVLGIWLGVAAPEVSPIFTEAPFAVGAGDPAR
jgi:hypothetical protein